ncbi:hypothetical protein ACE418_08555 [Megasphaera sp. WILCCON 0056]|uniref:hypothetical protein n=1 Tax=Megasphaera sp. WILCCON 0056 TaxID=3345340 RepID=UPI003A80EE91
MGILTVRTIEKYYCQDIQSVMPYSKTYNNELMFSKMLVGDKGIEPIVTGDIYRGDEDAEILFLALPILFSRKSTLILFT